MKIYQSFQKNRMLWLTLITLALLFLLAIQGMETDDWVITLLRGLSVGAVTFLVASGFSLIFGLMDVLNLAHGTLFMVGAYVGWTVYVRPDSVVDVFTPLALLVSGWLLIGWLKNVLRNISLVQKHANWLRWIALLFALAFLYTGWTNYPITVWDPGVYQVSPITFSYNMSQGNLVLPTPEVFGSMPAVVVMAFLWLAGVFTAVSFVSFSFVNTASVMQNEAQVKEKNRWALIYSVIAVMLGLIVFFANDGITSWLLTISTTWLFLIAIIAAVGVGAFLGGMMEATLIRPLYERPIYQLMLTLGVSAIGIEVVRAIWGRPGFTMPRPELFNGTGEFCPAETFTDWWLYHCSTMKVMGARIRIYNEIFIPIVGIVVLVAVWMLLQRTRLGMVIRAGVQDSEMVEALGINVRRVFTMIFALGVGLAAMGGVIAGPSVGLSNGMGESLLLNALIALAIGGLTSYPGAALGSLIVGLLQQFIIKYGAIGIPIPFMDELFKPTPPLVPASTVLLMVIILLVLPQGLFGRKE